MPQAPVTSKTPLVAKSARKADPLRTPCSRCGALGWERLERTSLYERLVLPFFGLYPWRCALCNRRRYLPYRADPRSTGYRG